jgi:hypothetical protein
MMTATGARRPTGDEALTSIETLLMEILRAPDRNARLSEWLQGNTPLPLNPLIEPYQWILRGIPAGNRRFPAITALAQTAAQLLKAPAPPNMSAEQSGKFASNLLLLCAGLARAEILAAPLSEVIHTGVMKNMTYVIPPMLALRSALIANQADASYESIWLEMLDGKDSGGLPGDPEAGFEGVRLMPHSEAFPDQPALSAIGKALTVMTMRVETMNDRKAQLEYYLTLVSDTYPGYPWDKQFIIAANDFSWPRWAVEGLPSLCVVTDIQADGSVRAYVWHLILKLLHAWREDAWLQMRNPMCDGVVGDVMLKKEALPYLEIVAPRMEEFRRSWPFKNTKSLEPATASQVVPEICANLRSDGREAIAAEFEVAYRRCRALGWR